MNTPATTYTVQVDDNAHYMDESHRVQDATFRTLEEAVDRCKAITEASLADLYENCMSAGDLYRQYTIFGEDPWICIEPHDGSKPPFSARDYAEARCVEICMSAAEACKPRETASVDEAPRGVPEQVFLMLARLRAREVLEIAQDEGVLRRTLHESYPLAEEMSLEPDSEQSAEAATTDERTMHVASMTWARLRKEGQTLLIEAMKQAVRRWEEVVELMQLWEPHELPEDQDARLQQEAIEEQAWREKQRGQDHGDR